MTHSVIPTADDRLANSHLSSHPKEEPKTLDYFDVPTIPDSPTKPFHPSTSSAAPPQYTTRRVIREDDHGAAPVANHPSAITPPSPQQSEARASALEQNEWEVRRIIGKRRAGKVAEYRVRWKDMWLRRSELGNAKRLLQEFEARHRAQQKLKKWKAAFMGKDRSSSVSALSLTILFIKTNVKMASCPRPNSFARRPFVTEAPFPAWTKDPLQMVCHLQPTRDMAQAPLSVAPRGPHIALRALSVHACAYGTEYSRRHT